MKSQVRASSTLYTDSRYTNSQDADMRVSAIRVDSTTQIISLFVLCELMNELRNVLHICISLERFQEQYL